MTKRKMTMIWFSVLMFSGLLMFSCASTAPAETEMPAVIPGPNESLLVIQRKKTMAGAAVSMKVWVDDTETASSIRNGQELRLIVSDGDHLIQAGSSEVDRGDAVSFAVDGEEITFFAEPQMGALAARFKLSQTGKRKL